MDIQRLMDERRKQFWKGYDQSVEASGIDPEKIGLRYCPVRGLGGTLIDELGNSYGPVDGLKMLRVCREISLDRDIENPGLIARLKNGRRGRGGITKEVVSKINKIVRYINVEKHPFLFQGWEISPEIVDACWQKDLDGVKCKKINAIQGFSEDGKRMAHGVFILNTTVGDSTTMHGLMKLPCLCDDDQTAQLHIGISDYMQDMLAYRKNVEFFGVISYPVELELIATAIFCSRDASELFIMDAGYLKLLLKALSWKLSDDLKFTVSDDFTSIVIRRKVSGLWTFGVLVSGLRRGHRRDYEAVVEWFGTQCGCLE